MIAIVAVDKNWAIGKDGDLLVRLPDDLKLFRELTKNSIVVMGQRTFESLPGGLPLAGRINVVLTHDRGFANHIRRFDNVSIVDEPTIQGSVQCIHEIKYPGISPRHKKVIVIGGGQVYEQLLPYCYLAIVTKIDAEFAGADTFFPDIDADADFVCAIKSEPIFGAGYTYRFCAYTRS